MSSHIPYGGHIQFISNPFGVCGSPLANMLLSGNISFGLTAAAYRFDAAWNILKWSDDRFNFTNITLFYILHSFFVSCLEKMEMWGKYSHEHIYHDDAKKYLNKKAISLSEAGFKFIFWIKCLNFPYFVQVIAKHIVRVVVSFFKYPDKLKTCNKLTKEKKVHP